MRRAVWSGAAHLQSCTPAWHVRSASAMAEETFFQRIKFFIYAGGIFFLYFYYGILQESM